MSVISLVDSGSKEIIINAQLVIDELLTFNAQVTLVTIPRWQS